MRCLSPERYDKDDGEWHISGRAWIGTLSIFHLADDQGCDLQSVS
jgi:hypothetical protein